jgi:hypothetical protein
MTATDRQDGDGLRIALEPFAKIADDYEASEQRRIRTHTDEEREPGAKLPDSHMVSIALGDCRNARFALDALPTRDGAEGAGRDAGIAEAIFDIEGGEPPPRVASAPPQPAPDAVRSADEPTLEMIAAAAEFHANGCWNASDESIFGGIYKAMRAAAPVPPADGAAPSMGQLRKVIYDEWGSHLCYRNSTTAERVCALGHCRCEDIARAILANFNVLPSTTGAAEEKPK